MVIEVCGIVAYFIGFLVGGWLECCCGFVLLVAFVVVAFVAATSCIWLLRD